MAGSRSLSERRKQKKTDKKEIHKGNSNSKDISSYNLAGEDGVKSGEIMERERMRELVEEGGEDNKVERGKKILRTISNSGHFGLRLRLPVLIITVHYMKV